MREHFTSSQRNCANVMISVMSVNHFVQRGVPCDYYPECIGPQSLCRGKRDSARAVYSVLNTVKSIMQMCALNDSNNIKEWQMARRGGGSYGKYFRENGGIKWLNFILTKVFCEKSRIIILFVQGNTLKSI